MEPPGARGAGRGAGGPPGGRMTEAQRRELRAQIMFFRATQGRDTGLSARALLEGVGAPVERAGALVAIARRSLAALHLERRKMQVQAGVSPQAHVQAQAQARAQAQAQAHAQAHAQAQAHAHAQHQAWARRQAMEQAFAQRQSREREAALQQAAPGMGWAGPGEELGAHGGGGAELEAWMGENCDWGQLGPLPQGAATAPVPQAPAPFAHEAQGLKRRAEHSPEASDERDGENGVERGVAISGEQEPPERRVKRERFAAEPKEQLLSIAPPKKDVILDPPLEPLESVGGDPEEWFSYRRGLLAALGSRAEKLWGGACSRALASLEAARANGELSALPRKERAKLSVQWRMLRLRELQKTVRAGVQKGQDFLEGQTTKERNKFIRQRRTVEERIERLGRKHLAERRVQRMETMRKHFRKQRDVMVSCRERLAVRNRRVLTEHARMAREHSKARGRQEQALKMQALTMNDMDAYKRLLKERGASAQSAEEKYEELASFLTSTEEYIAKYQGKIAQVKANTKAVEAVAAAVEEARLAGAGEKELNEVRQEAEARFLEAAARGTSTGATTTGQSYYSAAHSVDEVICGTPALLKPAEGGSLREYQVIGLQWMVSLYNNQLNGILADEMGLGKTVQIMALFAHLMEAKQICGPHLVVVPNAVLVNWRSELKKWLPSFRCVYYVGDREARLKEWQAHVESLQFNVMVTTYDYCMRDRAKLSRVQWQYMVIDEAHRMKDRESKLSRDISGFRTMRRLLLTGTPLQNDISELWSLLNLLLPDVFDNKAEFGAWFDSKPGESSEEEWLKREKRVVVIHRLHQILEPFMLRRQLADVEGSLPPKVQHVIKCAMSPTESCAYRWIQGTGTIISDPVAPRPKSQTHRYLPLNNRVNELRKLCNHYFLCYPPSFYASPAAYLTTSAKMKTLDRMLVKLFCSGHKVLLFSSMTKVLDIIENYLKWREVDGKSMKFLRIDGNTALDQRDVAIKEFNDPGHNVFIFLLSIRAAGRGLNLQTSDTVIIYDPDPNPKSEEQAIARAHRIGQTREVRVFHMESVVHPSYSWDLEGGMAPEVSPGAYKNSVETIVRTEIQQKKIEMANEIIDAGRFDMNTTNDERKQTLEKLLDEYDQDEGTTNHVPSQVELNELLARTPEEIRLFNRMDSEMDWPVEGGACEPVEDWLLYQRSEFLQVQQNNRGRSKMSLVGVPDAEGPGELRAAAPGANFEIAPGIDPGAILTGPRVRVTKSMTDFTEIDEDIGFKEKKGGKSAGGLSLSIKTSGRPKPQRAAVKPVKKNKSGGGMSLGDYEALLQQYKTRQQTDEVEEE